MILTMVAMLSMTMAFAEGEERKQCEQCRGLRHERQYE